MRRRLLALLVLLAPLLATGCGRGEVSNGSQRFRTPSMVYEGLDGGLPRPERAAYLQNLPTW